MKITVKAPAKINLMLDILGRREDGYHDLWMVMQSVSLYDVVTATSREDHKIVLTCSNGKLPTDKRNIAYQAALAFYEQTGVAKDGVSIHIEKQIPFAAGLAGGSADGAAVLVAMDELYQTRLSRPQFCEIGKKIGADVPFCIFGGTMIAQGIGERLTPLPAIPDCWIVLCKPDYGVSTARAFALFDAQGQDCRRPDKTGMTTALQEDNLAEVGRLLGNVFEQFVEVPDRIEMKAVFRRCHAQGMCMSGSGPTCFGLFAQRDDAQKAWEELKAAYPATFLCTPENQGCTILEKE